MELLTAKEVMSILRIESEDTFRSWLRRGQLPQNIILEIGKTKRFRKNILDKWIAGEV